MRSVRAREMLALSFVAMFVSTGVGTAYALAPGPLAGYSAAPTAASTQSVTTTFVVPTIKCKGVTGIQAVDDGARIDEPSGEKTTNSGAGVVLACFGKEASYFEHIQVDGENRTPTVTVKPRDTVTTRTEVSAIAVAVTLSDGAQSQTETGAGATATALDIGAIAANCNELHECVPVPHAGTSKFSAAQFDGVSAGAAGAAKKELVDSKEEVEMSSTNLKGKTKEAFDVKWVLSCGLEGTC